MFAAQGAGIDLLTAAAYPAQVFDDLGAHAVTCALVPESAAGVGRDGQSKQLDREVLGAETVFVEASQRAGSVIIDVPS